MNVKKKSKWNLWYSKKQNQGWFYKHGDKREKHLPPDAKVIKFYFSNSYNKVWPKCYDWIQENSDKYK